MTTSEDLIWPKKLRDACFPVTLTDVYVGNPSRRAKRYRAVVPVDGEPEVDPFAIVTDRYRLIRNEDVLDLGHEAFGRVFVPQHIARMAVFNVVMASGRGSFLADFTAPELNCSIPVPGPLGSSADPDPTRHTFFLRTVNSYNRTQAVRIEVGICRWICKNGLIFGKQSIRFQDTHHKDKHQLMDHISERAERLRTEALPSQIGNIYRIALPPGMTVLEGTWQTLKLAIPPVDPKSRTARFWRDRCAALYTVAQEYEARFGKTAFSVLQSASQWAREDALTSPVQRHSYEQRCGQMLESLTARQVWPESQSNATEQIERIGDWSRTQVPER